MKAYVALGANLGDARGAVEDAVRRIAALPQTTLLQRSPLYRTAPVDATGPDFYNAVVAIETALAPAALLQALHAIEAEHGRERPYRNAPRTLDLDLLLYGSEVIETPALTVPHPRLHERAFVLVPLLDIAPAAVHPRLGALAPWRERVAGQAIERVA
jgi:2-amino-4-hydroxy-6-hydroxymethyldihydropteridine diphosphokinase